MGEKDVGSLPPEKFLEIKNISKSFGGVHALIGASLTCKKGESHVLIGENGAGKSTLVKILCGAEQKDSGEIFLRGKHVEINSTFDAGLYGIAAVFQELSLIQDLSIAENIFLGYEVTNKIGRINFESMYKQIDEFFEDLGIDLNSRVLVRDLTLCDMQMVEIAKALFKKPEILILDEATSALGENEVKWLFNQIKTITKEQGNTVIFISHRMDELHQIADRATIYRNAKFVTTFDWGKLNDDEIVSNMTGKLQGKTFIKKNVPSSEEIVLKVSDANSERCLHDINFQLRKGEILGIAGLSGHGQVDLLHRLFGDGRFDSGKIIINGKETKIRNEMDALHNGIVLVPEDRKNEGLILTRSIAENISMMSLSKIQKHGVIDRQQEEKNIANSIKNLNIKTDDVELDVSSLSGGNQQKVVIAKALLVDTKVLLLSDPTRGIDIGTKNEIYKLITELAESGISILFYTTEVTEILLLCNRVMVFYEGKIISEIQGDQITEDNIIAKSLGLEDKVENL